MLAIGIVLSCQKQPGANVRLDPALSTMVRGPAP